MISEMETQMEMKKKAILICKRRFGNERKCQNVSGENKLQLCEKHFKLHKEFLFLANNPCLVTKEKRSQILGIETQFLTKKEKKKKKNKKKKMKKEIKEKELPPDELRCCITGGGGWRCKNVRMWVDAPDDSNVPDTKHCRQHYTYYYVDKKMKKKKRSGDSEGEGEGAGCITNCSNNKRRKKAVVAEDDETGIQSPATTSDTSDSDSTFIANIGTKRKKVDRTESAGEPKSLTESREPMVETSNHSNCLKQRKMATEDEWFVDKTIFQPGTNDPYDYDTSIKGGSARIWTKGKNVEKTEGSREPVVELECLEHYKSKCSDLSVDLDKKKEGRTILQGKLAEVETRKPTATDETEQTPADATDCWWKMFSDLDSRVLRLENENSKVGGCVESHISKLESLNKRMEDENLTMVGCVESSISNLESLVLRRGKESSILRCALLGNSEKIGSEARGLQIDVTQSGESLGTEDSDNSVDRKSSLGDLMDMLAMNKWNRNKNEEIKWKSEADMLSSFEDDPELCMKAVCALYRQKLSEDEISAKGFLHYRDVVRVTTLAEFLMDGDCKGDLKKSVKELKIFDSEAVEDCKVLAISYSEHLFGIYQNEKDPYFLPVTTACHGDQSAK